MAIVNYETGGLRNSVIPVEYFTQETYGWQFVDVTQGDNIYDLRIPNQVNTIFETEHSKATVEYYDNVNLIGIVLKLYYDNNQFGGVSAINDDYNFYGLAFGVDENAHLGYITHVQYLENQGYFLDPFYDPGDLLYYNFIKGIPPYVPPVQTYTSNGGGATHIAKVTGQLKDLSSNLSDILIVSGGGGGGMLIGDTAYPGADAGGIAGNGDNSADQTTGYAFGQGENG